MNAVGQTLCLSMIVKNEASVIHRCLDSVRPIIDYWVIVDTGSTDGTQEIIREQLKDLPGELHERPWQDFAHNRSEALELARPHGDYSLIIDADDALEIPKAFRLPELTADAYTLNIHDTSIQYQRTQVVRNRLPWRYAGVLHEFLTCEASRSAGSLSIVMRRNHDGARRRDPTTYQKDAAVLVAALLAETDPFLISRYTFYLAQSYRDCGEKEKALEKYLARSTLGFWQEEIFMSLLQAARLMEALDYPIDEVIDVYARATATAPTRAEALYGASRFCRYKGRFEQGYQLAKRGMAIRQPNGGLFVEPWIYDYGLLDELAVNAYWARYYQESLDACEKLLANSKFPVSQRDRIIANANFARGKLSDAGGRLPYDCQMQEHSPRPLKMPYFLGEVTMDSKFPFNICHVSINVHDRIFDDTIRVLRSALGDLGYPCSVQKNHLKAQAINIVVGSVVFAAKSGLLDYLKQQPYVLYQFEQLDYNYGHINAYPEYLDIIRSADQIFEYSPSGMHYLSQTGMGGKIAYLPPSFHRSLESFRPDENPDIDVLFFGSFSDRRNKILNELRSRGLKVVHAFGVYGRELVHHMKRAKIIINIHCVDGISTLETVRISLALANRCFVISEIGDHNPYGAGVVYADYDNLVSTCIEYLNYSAHECPAIATAGYVEYRRSDFVADLRSALSRMPMRDLLRGVGSTGGTSEVTSADQNCVGNRLEPSGNLDPYLKYDLTSGLHTGIPYLEFLKIISSQMRPRSYLEIGTESGVSLRQFECDAICIDPAFQITSDVLAKRERTFFFQMTSNCFFANADPLKFFPRGVDVGFLDGLHHFEALLMDFINFEHNSHANSMAILHDCLPTDLLMTSRTFRWGGWTGDVWRVLLALKKYRQDLRIMLLDCPPTGLVVCTGMDSGSTILEARYEEIVEEFSAIHLDEAGLRGLRSLFPLVDTRKFLADGMGIARLFAPISW